MSVDAYQLFDPLSEAEYQALKESIRERGILVPVELDDCGNILDGHHRIKAWGELKSDGLSLPDYPRIIRKFQDDAEKRNHIRTLNIVRRHLTTAQMIPYWEDMRKDGMTYQAIADASGVSQPTIINAVAKFLATQPEHITGKDGKKYPPKRKRAEKVPQLSIFANTQQQEEQAKEAATKIEKGTNGKVLDTKRAARVAREQESERKRVDAEEQEWTTPDLQILIGDFREIAKQIPDSSIDLIFTDPPYPEEYLPLWSDLSSVAARILKPGKLLIAYSGQLYLPEVMARLVENLEYVWLGSLHLRGPHNEVHIKKVHNHSKPLLFYSKDAYTPEIWFSDTYYSEGKDKEYHEWQQAEGAALYYIEALTKPGGKVFEPFLGGGTTASAAVKLRRSFIGCDIDKLCVLNTVERLNNDEAKHL